MTTSTAEIDEQAAAIATHFGWPLAFFRGCAHEWARCENTNAAHNPFACTQKVGESTVFNSDGVQEFASAADGVQSFIWEIDPTTYSGIDYYPNLRRAFANGAFESHNRADCAREMSTWGTKDFASEIASGWNPPMDEPIPAPVPAETPVPDPVPESTPIIDATIEARVTGLVSRIDDLNARVDALNDAVLKRLKFLADTFAVAADPNHIPE